MQILSEYRKYQKRFFQTSYRTFSTTDDRIKHTIAEQIKVIKMYTEGVGIRSIERLEGISSSIIISWLRKAAELIMKTKTSTPIKKIRILEQDELYT